MINVYVDVGHALGETAISIKKSYVHMTNNDATCQTNDNLQVFWATGIG